jgi:hypothetical protein
LTRLTPRRGLLVWVFFAALAVINSYPLARAPHATIGQHGDA